jgi:hypothetical protein
MRKKNKTDVGVKKFEYKKNVKWFNKKRCGAITLILLMVSTMYFGTERTDEQNAVNAVQPIEIQSVILCDDQINVTYNVEFGNNIRVKIDGELQFQNHSLKINRYLNSGANNIMMPCNFNETFAKILDGVQLRFIGNLFVSHKIHLFITNQVKFDESYNLVSNISFDAEYQVITNMERNNTHSNSTVIGEFYLPVAAKNISNRNITVSYSVWFYITKEEIDKMSDPELFPTVIPMSSNNTVINDTGMYEIGNYSGVSLFSNYIVRSNHVINFDMSVDDEEYFVFKNVTDYSGMILDRRIAYINNKTGGIGEAFNNPPVFYLKNVTLYINNEIVSCPDIECEVKTTGAK